MSDAPNPDQILVDELARQIGVLTAQRTQLEILLKLANDEIAELRAVEAPA